MGNTYFIEPFLDCPCLLIKTKKRKISVSCLSVDSNCQSHCDCSSVDAWLSVYDVRNLEVKQWSVKEICASGNYVFFTFKFVMIVLVMLPVYRILLWIYKIIIIESNAIHNVNVTNYYLSQIDVSFP